MSYPQGILGEIPPTRYNWAPVFFHNIGVQIKKILIRSWVEVRNSTYSFSISEVKLVAQASCL